MKVVALLQPNEKKLMKRSVTIILFVSFVLTGMTSIVLAGTGRWSNTSSNYISYSNLGNPYKAVSGGDPHGGYLTTTSVCSFCHAVHNAGTDYDGNGVYKLTRSSTSNLQGACFFCHVSGSVVTQRPYDTTGYTNIRAQHRIDGSATIIPDAIVPTGPASQLGSNSVLNCVDCHNAAPHGAGESYYLFRDKDPSGAFDLNYVCMRCHNKNYTTAFDTNSHPMVLSEDGNVRGNRQVPVVPDGTSTESCMECHQNENGNPGGVGFFPHISEAARFLNTDVGDLNTAGTGGQLDSLCLRCHDWFYLTGITTMGVGKTF